MPHVNEEQHSNTKHLHHYAEAALRRHSATPCVAVARERCLGIIAYFPNETSPLTPITYNSRPRCGTMLLEELRNILKITLNYQELWKHLVFANNMEISHSSHTLDFKFGPILLSFPLISDESFFPYHYPLVVIVVWPPSQASHPPALALFRKLFHISYLVGKDFLGTS
ncbi:hypothetical protein E2C01_033808 [Portunus trituberculatus]|uniref:Uncharacterized protein n=1 Tax=Portunus trituberculatus TaxID=210409 RepID=A0A5B7F139_PORTR|nr:hypothetical protein [Portunus trituberculatus]